MKSFFHWNPEHLGLDRQVGQKNEEDKFWDIWGILGRTISTHFNWYSESLVHFFHHLTINSTKKLVLFIHILNIYLGLGRTELRILSFCVRSPWRDLWEHMGTNLLVIVFYFFSEINFSLFLCLFLSVCLLRIDFF